MGGPVVSARDTGGAAVSPPQLPPTVPVGWLTDAVASVFGALGFSAPAAALVAGSLVDADMRGIGSHGVMLLPMYVERIRAGSVSRAERAEVVRDSGAVAVLDAGHALGQLTGDQAMRLAVDKARTYGVGVVTVRRAFHFGGAFRYVDFAARNGCVGIAAANTRPLMPAPGGASAVVGNNPLAVGVPRASGRPVILDVALSEAALGKVRLAAGEGRQIPATWATDEQGRPTTDPAAALRGLLLPSGAHKGYGLALMIDVLTGVLSGGSYGRGVQGLYADVSVPNDCAHFFLALDAEAFAEEADEIGRRVDDLAGQVLGSALAPGTDRVHLPGDIEADRYDRARREGVTLAPSVSAKLVEIAAGLGVPLAAPGAPVAAEGGQ
jgi:LDH2 family malate/lactate/ureidoglycolate dehydrogenase